MNVALQRVNRAVEQARDDSLPPGLVPEVVITVMMLFCFGLGFFLLLLLLLHFLVIDISMENRMRKSGELPSGKTYG